MAVVGGLAEGPDLAQEWGGSGKETEGRDPWHRCRWGSRNKDRDMAKFRC